MAAEDARVAKKCRVRACAPPAAAARRRQSDSDLSHIVSLIYGNPRSDFLFIAKVLQKKVRPTRGVGAGACLCYYDALTHTDTHRVTHPQPNTEHRKYAVIIKASGARW